MDYEQILNREKAELDLLLKTKSITEERLAEAQKKKEIIAESLEITNLVMKETQVKIKDFIEEVVTLALQVVFGVDYKFLIDYEIKRNKSEANIYVIINDRQYEMDEVGGGVVDICSFGMRVALWALANNPEPVLILDEPARCLSSDKQEIFAEMLLKISKMFNIQIIMVSHIGESINSADKIFNVTIKDGISKVKEN